MLTAADSWRERSGAVRSEGQWIAALHHTAQRLLERRSVVISFAEPADDALAARWGAAARARAEAEFPVGRMVEGYRAALERLG